MSTAEPKLDGRPPVAVKGVKGGLLFMLDEQCPFDALYNHLLRLLEGDLSNLFHGPEIPVYVDYGTRLLGKAEIRSVLELFLRKENFILKEFSGSTEARKSMFHNRRDAAAPHTIYKGTVRAGQQLLFEGDVVVVGDVNPGGEVLATGDIYVLGKLKGTAHAGVEGNNQAVIAAAEFAPMQLRIADAIYRAPDADKNTLRAFMEFAYLRDDGMAVDKLVYIQSIRRER